MALQLIPFRPSAIALFQFQATLDGVAWNVTITWSLAGQRWYLNIRDLQGNLKLARAVVGSPSGSDINLIGGFFATSTLVYRQGTQNFEVGP